MDTAQHKPIIVVISLLAATVLCLIFMPDSSVIDETGLADALPDTIGNYRGHDIRFCQDMQCMRSFTTNQLKNENICLSCGSDLNAWAPGEIQILPADTVILRKQYLHPSGRAIQVSIVISGKDRTSIHRPQMCLTGSGHQLVQRHSLDIDVKGRGTLKTTLLDTKLRNQRRYAYAYWFSSQDQETPYHLERMLWMGLDNLFKGKIQRWSYISLMTTRSEGSDEHLQELNSFISELYPLIRREGEGLKDET
jgi:hypothetical protein